jgi:redox-sensitive bicupin YhaK (pirin superfamily)
MLNKIRSVELIIPPPQPHMVGTGFRMLNFFPNSRTVNMKRMSPFFLMDYAAKSEYKPTSKPLGVGVHPHRGFETVSIVYQGRVAHNDSAGNSGVIKDGDVQWMTAASGILHKEYHEKSWSKKGGILQMVQLWVNLPAKYKMSKPKYQTLEHKKIGKFELHKKMGIVEVIAGNYQKVKGPAFTFTPIEMYNARVKKNADIVFSFPEEYNTGFLVIEGIVNLNDKKVPTDHFVLFANDGTDIHLNATTDAIVLILSGEPIKEPIVQYGPFVMNTQDEILQAYEDLNRGKFGTLEN